MGLSGERTGGASREGPQTWPVASCPFPGRTVSVPSLRKTDPPHLSHKWGYELINYAKTKTKHHDFMPVMNVLQSSFRT